MLTLRIINRKSGKCRGTTIWNNISNCEDMFVKTYADGSQFIAAAVLTTEDKDVAYAHHIYKVSRSVGDTQYTVTQIRPDESSVSQDSKNTYSIQEDIKADTRKEAVEVAVHLAHRDLKILQNMREQEVKDIAYFQAVHNTLYDVDKMMTAEWKGNI